MPWYEKKIAISVSKDSVLRKTRNLIKERRKTRIRWRKQRSI
jgi:hypothetical protein